MLAAAGVTLTSVAGCALVPPGGPTPSLSPTPDATPDPGYAAFAGVHQALASAHADETDPGRFAVLVWALDVAAEQAAAIRTTVPAVPSRTPPPTPTPAASPGAPPASAAPDAFPALRAALEQAAPMYRARALDPSTAQPLVWASMAAWAVALATTAGHDVPLEPARDRLPPPVQTVAEADQAATSAVAATLYGVQTAGGAPGLTPDDLDRIRARVVFWSQLRDDLRRSLGPTPSAGPTPAPAWFQVPRPTDAAGAAALVVRLESAALPILGRSLAFGSDPLRARLAPALAGVASDLPSWGGSLLRWPGWPDPAA